MADILVIKLSALGDFIQALGPFRAIRAHHTNDQITLLTTKPYEALAKAIGLFDHILIDPKPKPWEFRKSKSLLSMLRSKPWSMVYDLQTSGRSSRYYRLLPAPRPKWSGIAEDCSHPHSNPHRDFMHTMDRQAEQLAMAGIKDIPPADWRFADNVDLDRFELPERFVLLVPGGAPTRPRKRWPVAFYRKLAEKISDMGLSVIALGTAAERDILETLTAGDHDIRALTDQTDFVDIIALAGKAQGAVGNDTGPMHILGARGLPSVVLFSDDSDPELCAPRGEAVEVIQVSTLSDLPVDQVFAAFRTLTKM